MYLCVYVYMCVYIYIYVCLYMYVYEKVMGGYSSLSKI